MSEDEKNRLFSLLEAHGQSFLCSFDFPPASQQRTSSSSHEQRGLGLREVSPCRSEEEWKGFNGLNSHDEESSSGERDEGLST